MENRLQDLLKIIDYELESFRENTITLKDLTYRRPIIDVLDLPSELVSDDELRKFRGDVQDSHHFFHVQSTKKALGSYSKGEVDSFKVTSFQNQEGEDIYSFSFTLNGHIFDIQIGKRGEEGFRHYKMREVFGNNPITMDMHYTIGKDGQHMVVSKSSSSVTEKMEVLEGQVSLQRNHECLETLTVHGSMDPYLMSALSVLDYVIDSGNKGISSLNPDLLCRLQEQFPFLSHLLYLNDGCMDADLLDSYFRKHHFMLDQEKTYS